MGGRAEQIINAYGSEIPSRYDTGVHVENLQDFVCVTCLLSIQKLRRRRHAYRFSSENQKGNVRHKTQGEPRL
jgi:hypothetical protein